MAAPIVSDHLVFFPPFEATQLTGGGWQMTGCKHLWKTLLLCLCSLERVYCFSTLSAKCDPSPRGKNEVNSGQKLGVEIVFQKCRTWHKLISQGGQLNRCHPLPSFLPIQLYTYLVQRNLCDRKEAMAKCLLTMASGTGQQRTSLWMWVCTMTQKLWPNWNILPWKQHISMCIGPSTLVPNMIFS